MGVWLEDEDESKSRLVLFNLSLQECSIYIYVLLEAQPVLADEHACHVPHLLRVS